MYKVTVTGLKEVVDSFKNLRDCLNSEEMMNYVGDKCERTLYKVTNDNLTSVDDLEVSEYARNHQKQIEGNRIILSNNTMADLSNLSLETQANYPNGFSIAQAIEYGTGIVGASSAASSIAAEYGWEYDVNQHGEKGWFYVKDGQLWHSKGFEGRLIYYKTTKEIADNINEWLIKYLESKTK